MKYSEIRHVELITRHVYKKKESLEYDENT